ncbi:MAG: HAD-IA family hydrolase, partial [Chromatiaceae bacterium]
PNKKPAPDIYTWVLAAMGLPPERVIAFEDSGHGVTSAMTSGIEHIVVTVNDYTLGQDFSAATVVLDNLGEPAAHAQPVLGTAPAQGIVDIAYLQALMSSGQAGR